jgi:DNA-binding response OmpR family regulator
MRILLVESEIELTATLTKALAGQDILVDHVNSIALADEAVRAGVHDALLLDSKLPDGDGVKLIKHLRSDHFAAPVIVLANEPAQENIVRVLDSGADDILVKPFSVNELSARLRAVMRRPASLQPRTIRVGGVEFNPQDQTVRIADSIVALPRRQLLALDHLIRRAGRIVSRTALEEAVYGFEDDVAPNSLEAHISRLRRALAPGGVTIHAERGLGYVLKEIGTAAAPEI